MLRSFMATAAATVTVTVSLGLAAPAAYAAPSADTQLVEVALDSSALDAAAVSGCTARYAFTVAGNPNYPLPVRVLPLGTISGDIRDPINYANYDLAATFVYVACVL